MDNFASLAFIYICMRDLHCSADAVFARLQPAARLAKASLATLNAIQLESRREGTGEAYLAMRGMAGHEFAPDEQAIIANLAKRPVQSTIGYKRERHEDAVTMKNQQCRKCGKMVLVTPGRHAFDVHNKVCKAGQ
jgi:hypothetical protein